MISAEIVLDGLKSSMEHVWLKWNNLKMKVSESSKSDGALRRTLSMKELGSSLAGNTTAYFETNVPVSKRSTVE